MKRKFFFPSENEIVQCIFGLSLYGLSTIPPSCKFSYVNHQLRLLLIGCGQLNISYNQIERLFDHRFFGKESIGIFLFLHGDSHQEKVGFETTPFKS